MYLPQAVAAGVNHFTEALGSSIFEYLAQHEQEARQLGAAMSVLSLPVIREAAEVLQGLVLDLPHAVPGAAAQASRRGLGGRVAAAAGDFFDGVPPADVYLLPSRPARPEHAPGLHRPGA
jgi:hypothetical protein